MSLIDLPNPKWLPGTGRQVILKEDLLHIEEAILESGGGGGTAAWGAALPLEWIDAGTLTIRATADSPVSALMKGFPNILNSASSVTGYITDGIQRINVANESMIIASGGLYGTTQTEKSSQYYLVYALADDEDTDFYLQIMPYMRVSSQAGQVITLRNSLNTADIGYGFTTDELVDGAIYMLSGDSRGLLRAITANNNNDATGGTITYGGDALSVAQGDWFIVLPPAINFRAIGDVFNNASGNLEPFNHTGVFLNFIDDPLASSVFYRERQVVAVSLVTFTGLLPDVRYRLSWDIVQNTSQGLNYIGFNEYYTGGYVNADDAATTYIPVNFTGSGVVATYASKGHLDFCSIYALPKKVMCIGYNVFYDGDWKVGIPGGYFDGDGVNDLYAVTFKVSAGTISGKLLLESK